MTIIFCLIWVVSWAWSFTIFIMLADLLAASEYNLALSIFAGPIAHYSIRYIFGPLVDYVERINWGPNVEFNAFDKSTWGRNK